MHRKPLTGLQGHKSQILCLTFSPDATKMVTASKDGTWRVWNIDVRYHQQEDAKCMLHHKQEVSSLCAAHVFGTQGLVYASRGVIIVLPLSFDVDILKENHP